MVLVQAQDVRFSCSKLWFNCPSEIVPTEIDQIAASQPRNQVLNVCFLDKNIFKIM